MALILESLMRRLQDVECLNEHATHNCKGMLSGRGQLHSDCDEQLLMHLRFPPNEAVRIHTVRMLCPAQYADQAPRTVRFFINNGTLLFQNVENMPPAQEVVLSWKPSTNPNVAPGTLEAEAQLCKLSYHNAYHVALYVVDNMSQGDEDVTVISGLDLLGHLAKGLGTTALPKRG